MQGQDVRDEILRLAAELRLRCCEACAESARIIANSRQLATEAAHAAERRRKLQQSRS